MAPLRKSGSGHIDLCSSTCTTSTPLGLRCMKVETSLFSSSSCVSSTFKICSGVCQCFLPRQLRRLVPWSIPSCTPHPRLASLTFSWEFPPLLANLRMESRCDVCNRWSLLECSQSCCKNVQIRFPEVKLELVQLQRLPNSKLSHCLVCVVIL